MNTKAIGAMALAALAGCTIEARGADCNCAKTRWNWNPSGYVGAAAGYGTARNWSQLSRFADSSFSGQSNNDADAAFRVFAGLDFLRHFSLELGYADFGRDESKAQSDGSGTFWAAGPVREALTFRSFDLSLLGKVRLLPSTFAYLRAGAVMTHREYSISGNAQSSGAFNYQNNGNPVSALVGLGAAYDGFDHWQIRGEYSQFRLREDTLLGTTVRVGAVSFTYLF